MGDFWGVCYDDAKHDDAAKYKGRGPHRIAMFHYPNDDYVQGDPYDRTRLPEEWVPNEYQEVELVACMKAKRSKKLEDCEYSWAGTGEPTVKTIYSQKYTIELRTVREARTIDTFKLTADECPYEYDSDLPVANIDSSALNAKLEPSVEVTVN